MNEQLRGGSLSVCFGAFSGKRLFFLAFLSSYKKKSLLFIWKTPIRTPGLLELRVASIGQNDFHRII